MRSALPLLMLALGCGRGALPNDAGASDASDSWPALGECVDFTGAHVPFDMLSGSAGEVHYRLWRCERDRGVGLSFGWHGEAFELAIGAQTYRADSSAITYHPTLHNALDTLDALIPGATLHWRQHRDETDPSIYTFFVSAEADAGTPLLIETQVE